MEIHITDEKTGISYTLCGDYYLPDLILPDEKEKTNRCLGAKALRYLKKHKRLVYLNLLTSGKLNEYLASVNEQAEDMFLAGKGICRQAGSGEAVEIGKSD